MRIEVRRIFGELCDEGTDWIPSFSLTDLFTERYKIRGPKVLAQKTITIISREYNGKIQRKIVKGVAYLKFNGKELSP